MKKPRNHSPSRCATTLTLAASLLSFALLVQTAPAQAAGCAELRIENIRVGQGPLMIAAYTDAASFGRQAATSIELAVRTETMAMQVCNLDAEPVAFTLFQDLNRNGRLDTNPFGLPTEPWGASGTSSPLARPSWASAAVQTSAGPVRIRMSQ